MKRRRLLLGAGTLLGAGGTLGTGAFTSVEADRSVSVAVADDADALLTMEPSSGPNGEYAETTGDGTIALDFTDTDAGGTGLGTDSTYQFDDVFRITNQGTQPVYVWATFSGASGSFTPDGPDTDVHLYPNGDSDDRLRDSDDDVLYLGVGQSAGIGVYVDTTGVTTDQELTMTVNADAENPASASGAVVGGGGSPLGPVNGLVSYWPLDSIGDGTAEDVVRDNSGTVRGAVSSASGQISQAASFDGTDDFVETPSVQIDGSLTVAAWVKQEASSGYAAVSTQGSGFGGTPKSRNWWLGANGDGGVHWSIFDQNGTNRNVDTPSGTLPTGEFVHIAGVYDKASADLRVFVDGTIEEQRSFSSPFTPKTSDDPGAIGAESVGSDRRIRLFQGVIDDLRIYGRALSASEISDLYGQSGGGGGS
jgi:hypothetical protein